MKKSIVTRHNGIRDKNYKDMSNGTSLKKLKPEQKRKSGSRRQKAKPSFLGYISPDDDEGSNNPENRTPRKEKVKEV